MTRTTAVYIIPEVMRYTADPVWPEPKHNFSADQVFSQGIG